MQDLQTFLKSFIDRVCSVLFFFSSSSCPTPFSNLNAHPHQVVFFFCETAKAVKCVSHILMYIGDREQLVCSTVGLSQGNLVVFFLLAEEVREKSLVG